VVNLKSSKTATGRYGLVKREKRKNIDIGYVFLSRYHGHGYAPDAVKAMM